MKTSTVPASSQPAHETIRANLAHFARHDLIACTTCSYVGPAGLARYEVTQGCIKGGYVLVLASALLVLIFYSNGYPMWLFWFVVLPLLAYVLVSPAPVYQCPHCLADNVRE